MTGVRLHHRTTMPATLTVGVPRARPELAVVHAAGWARSDREAALLLCLVVQQRLLPGERLLRSWTERAAQAVTRPRRTVLDLVVRDVGELDLGPVCRAAGIPLPARQVLRTLPSGRAWLDARWDRGLVAEIDGVQHTKGLAPVEDALRQNELTLGHDTVLRIPVLGLRLQPAAFAAQLARAYRAA